MGSYSAGVIVLIGFLFHSASASFSARDLEYSKNSTSLASNTSTITSKASSTSAVPKPYPIELTQPSINGSKYGPITRPSWVSDNEPLSCYPEHILRKTPKWWRGQKFPDNQCFTTNANKCKDWTPCHVSFKGEVQLLYFPTTTPGPNHVTTMYDPHFDYTFTSPSAYILFHSISAWAGCSNDNMGTQKNSQLGPTMKHAFFPFSLGDLKTLAPHEKGATAKYMSTKPLTLSDLYSDCSSVTFNRKSAFSNRSPTVGDRGYRCFPRLAIPKLINSFAQPWWKGCSVLGKADGMIDPPVALTPGVFNIPNTALPSFIPEFTDSPPIPAPETATVAPGATPIPDQPKVTDAPMLPVPAHNGDLQPQPNNPASANNPSQNSPDNNPAPNNPPPASNVSPDNQVNHESSNNPAAVNNPQNNPTPGTNASPDNQGTGNNPPPVNNPSPGQSQPVTAVSVAIIGTDVVSAVPGVSGNTPAGFILPGGSTLKAGEVATLPAQDGSGKSVIASVASAAGNGNGNLVISTVGAPSATTIQALNPVVGSDPGAGSGVTPLADSRTVVYMSQTLVLGGPVATISSLNAAVTYGPLGVIVQYPGGKASTISVPGVTNPTLAGGAAPGNEASVGSIINSVMNAGAPAPTLAKSSIPGQALIGKPSSSAGVGSGKGNGTSGNSTVLYTGDSTTIGSDHWLFLGLAVLAVFCIL